MKAKIEESRFGVCPEKILGILEIFGFIEPRKKFFQAPLQVKEGVNSRENSIRKVPNFSSRKKN